MAGGPEPGFGIAVGGDRGREARPAADHPADDQVRAAELDVAGGDDDDPVDDRRLRPLVVKAVKPIVIAPVRSTRWPTTTWCSGCSGPAGSWPCPQPARATRSRASTARLRVDCATVRQARIWT